MLSSGSVTARTPEEGARSPALLLVAVVAVGSAIAIFLTAASRPEVLVLLGIPDPGVITSYGLPAMRFLAEGAAALTVGWLLLAAFLVTPQANGVLDVDGYRAVRSASTAAFVWGASAAALVPLTLSDVTGEPLTEMLKPDVLLNNAGALATSSAWRSTAFLALGLALVCRATIRWSWTPYLLGWAILALMPLATSGHSSAGGSHDMATNSLILHLVAACLWAGGLMALWLHARRGGSATDVAARRFSNVAVVAFAVMALSGLVNALTRLPVSDLFTSDYGRLILAKAAVLGILGLLGLAHRRQSLPALAANPGATGPLLRFAGIEALAFAAAMGIAVGLGRTPPPVSARQSPSAAEEALGYALPDAPSIGNLLLQWRFDLIFGSLAVVAALVYVAMVRRLRRSGMLWPRTRTMSWLFGCFVVLAATSSGVGRYSHAMFSMHLAEQIALSVVASALLAMAAPVTLALKVLKPAGQDGLSGPYEWMTAASTSPPARWLTGPLSAPALFVAGFFGLYLAGLFDAVLTSHPAHLTMNLYFIATGYGLMWMLIGADPTPMEVRRKDRILAIVAVVGALAVFSLILRDMTNPIGGWFYRSLGLPWINVVSDQNAAVTVSLAGTGLLGLVAALILLRREERPAA